MALLRGICLIEVPRIEKVSTPDTFRAEPPIRRRLTCRADLTARLGFRDRALD
jgi:hypothetical protein